jgi:hypothetical protein
MFCVSAPLLLDDYLLSLLYKGAFGSNAFVATRAFQEGVLTAMQLQQLQWRLPGLDDQGISFHSNHLALFGVPLLV